MGNYAQKNQRFGAMTPKEEIESEDPREKPISAIKEPETKEVEGDEVDEAIDSGDDPEEDLADDLARMRIDDDKERTHEEKLAAAADGKKVTPLRRKREMLENEDVSFQQMDWSDDPHRYTKKGTAMKVVFVRTIGEVATMLGAWLFVMQGMNGLMEKRLDRFKWGVARKHIRPVVEKLDGFLQNTFPGIVTKEVVEAREAGNLDQLAREYAPYFVDLPTSLVVGTAGKLCVQEELNKRLDVPLSTHENVFSAGLDNAVQLGSVLYLAHGAGKVPKEKLEQFFTHVLAPIEKDPHKLSKLATYATNIQVPNMLAFGVSSKYMADKVMEEIDRQQNEL